MIFRRQVEISILRLNPNDLRPIILILVVGLDRGHLSEGNGLSGFFIDLFLDKTIEMSFGEDHPALFPLFENPGTLD